MDKIEDVVIKGLIKLREDVDALQDTSAIEEKFNEHNKLLQAIDANIKEEIQKIKQDSLQSKKETTMEAVDATSKFAAEKTAKKSLEIFEPKFKILQDQLVAEKNKTIEVRKSIEKIHKKNSLVDIKITNKMFDGAVLIANKNGTATWRNL